MTDAQIKALIARGVADALAERDADMSRNGDGSYDSGGDGRRRMLVACECTYTNFLKCQPMNFKGTKGFVGRTQWIEKMEFVFYISNCTVACQIKFATCTLQGNALTWWNSHVKGTDVLSYDQRFQELALMCGRMFPEESYEVEKYVGGLPDMIYGSVMASKPKTMHDAIEFATKLIDQKIHTITEHQDENKRKFDDNNQTQQQPPKKKNVAMAYSAGSNEKKEYVGTLPLCNKCKFHHNGPCTAKSDCSKLNNQNYGNQTGGTRSTWNGVHLRRRRKLSRPQ
nr:hypothetical protein [Tanacetum cinerariifolium]